MEITYTKQGDYLLPNLTLKQTKKVNINKYGRMRLAYLKEYKKALYTSLLMKEELTNHLISVSKNAEDLLNTLMESYKKSDERLSEKNKKNNHIEWAKLMNSYKNTAEEIILKELIYNENVWVHTHILCIASTEFVLPYKFYYGNSHTLKILARSLKNYENKK